MEKRNRRTGARYVPIRTASPITKEVFAEMIKQNMKLSEMAAAMKTHENNLTNWRSGKAEPRVLSIEEMATRLGYRLALVPIAEDRK